MKTLEAYAREMGLRGAINTLLAGAALAVALFALYRVSGDPLGQAPLTDETRVVAATGSGLYDVEPFCDDPLTTVWASTDPEGEITYELERVRDGKQEAVTWNAHTQGATHWWFEDTLFDGTVQNSEPALVNGDAEDCIRDKAKAR